MDYLLIDILDLLKCLSVHALLAGHQLNGLVDALPGFGQPPALSCGREIF